MEIEFNIKHQQIVSGVSLTAYWLANYAMDLVKYLAFGAFAPLLLMAFDIKIFLDDGNVEFLWILFLTYGFGIITFAYVLSFKYKDASNA